MPLEAFPCVFRTFWWWNAVSCKLLQLLHRLLVVISTIVSVIKRLPYIHQHDPIRLKIGSMYCRCVSWLTTVAFCWQILSKDSVTVAVDAVVYYRVSNATISVVNVENAAASTRLLAQTTLRTVLGTKNLSEILSDRENISHFMQVTYRHCL